MNCPQGGEIHVEIAAEESWQIDLPGDQLGIAIWADDGNQGVTHLRGHGLSSPTTPGRGGDAALAHEFLHAMGMHGHFEIETEISEELTLLVPHIHSRPSFFGLTILFPVDIRGLRMMYDPMSLGDWNVTSSDVNGCMDEVVCFGALKIQGNADPWAHNGGLAPYRPLGDNTALHGTVTWRGRLIGLTPRDEVVAPRHVSEST